MKCEFCEKEIEYDEGKGNLEDGYTCFECIENKMKCKHEFVIFEDGIMVEGEEVTLSCNYLDCEEKRDFKIVSLEMEEVGRESDKNTLNNNNKPSNLKDSEKDGELLTEDRNNYGDGMYQCIQCGEIFDETDLDKYDGDWICRECEEDLK